MRRIRWLVGGANADDGQAGPSVVATHRGEGLVKIKGEVENRLRGWTVLFWR